MMILSHGPICIGIPLKDMLSLPIGEPQVMGTGQIVENLLDHFPMHGPGVCTEVRHHCNGKHDVWAHGEHGPVKCADGLTIGHIAHCCKVGRG